MMEDTKQLIRQAFKQARVSGKPDWHRMTTAVLKNRLLSITGNAFNETEYGADTFTSFILGHSDLVDIDRSRFPPIVELREPGSNDLDPGYANPASSRPKIRSDLWRAALDYSSGTEYVWDTVYGQARPSRPGEDMPTLPRVTLTVHQQWRREFVDTVRASTSITSEQENQANTWVQHQLPTPRLPFPLIPQWNGFLRDKVHQHLLSWFGESGLDPPSNLVTTVAERTTPRSSDAEVLRQFVLRVVREMTEHELTQLNLPSRAVLRVTKSSQ